MTLPFLLLATRPEDAPADAEYESFLKHGGLDESGLVRHRLEQTELGDLNLDQFSGIVVSGSPYTTTDPHDEKTDNQLRVEAELARMLDEVVARDFPFFGACYGVGTLGLHQGGVLDLTYGEDVSAVPIHVTQAGAQDPLLFGLPTTMNAYVGHKEALSTLPANAILLARGDACPHQMFRIKENLYATQFHPELDEAGILERMSYYDGYGYYPEGAAAAVASTLIGADIGPIHEILARFIQRYQR